MIFIRSVVYYFFLTLSVALFGIPLAVIGWLMPMAWRQAIASQWGKLNLHAQKLICGLGYTLEGEENLPTGPAVVMAKHQSAWETIALRGLLRKEQAWVLKKELMWLPVFGWAIAVLAPIAIDRKAGRQAARRIVEHGKQRLAAGRTVVIFPEGTRTAPGTRKRYGVGGGLLAEKSGVAVIPIAHNAGVYWRRRGLKKYPGTIRVVIGKPMKTGGLSAAQITHNVENWIEDMQARLALAPESGPVDNL